MSADLTKPFDPACCEGSCGPKADDNSAQSCGCDKGANWMCERHRAELEFMEKLRESKLDD